jgi:hypothetical protein
MRFVHVFRFGKPGMRLVLFEDSRTLDARW